MNQTSKTLYQYLENRYCDPVCTIDLSETGLIYGTMLGRSIFYDIPENKTYILSEQQDENITGVNFLKNDKTKFYVANGDFEVLKCQSFKNKVPKFDVSENYSSKGEHSNKCENCFCLLYDIHLLRIYLHLPQNTDDPVAVTPCDYIVKNIDNEAVTEGQIEMSNYAVPFDYNGRNLVWIDFYNDNLRALCIFSFVTQEIVQKIELKKDFGHVSHLKFLPDNRYFVVLNYTQCQIRNDKFEVINSFSHLGVEVLDFGYYIENDILIVSTLDIYGNVNVYDEQKKNNETIFNMYELDSISQELKDKQFFSMGFPYFIRINKNYVVITTDYGVYIIKR